MNLFEFEIFDIDDICSFENIGGLSFEDDRDRIYDIWFGD